MTKADFLWCLAHTRGDVSLWLDFDGDGWVCACHVSVMCHATRKAPRKDKSGKRINSLRTNCLFIAGFQGGSLIDTERNARVRDRAQRALDKYSRWAREAIGNRFMEPK